METEIEELSKAYDPTEIERRWYDIWQEAGVFRAEASETLEGGKPTYVIMMPPPNVTGTLHNGHALFVTIQDILIRFHRMKGYNVLLSTSRRRARSRAPPCDATAPFPPAPSFGG